MSSPTADLLPDDVVWNADGHLSDVALTCIVDGEVRIVPPAAHTHLSACEPCTRRLGEAAVLSLSSTDAIQSTLVEAAMRLSAQPSGPERGAVVHASGAPSSSTPGAAAAAPSKRPASKAGAASRRPTPLPVPAIAGALTLAVIGAIPAVVEQFMDLPRTTASVTVALPVVARTLVVVLRAPESGLGPFVTVVSWASAAMLVGVGVWFARAASRKRSVQGGMR